MKKLALQLISAGSVAILLTGCSTFFPDHADDYQKTQPMTVDLKVPAGSMPLQNALVIPNEDKIAKLEAVKPFQTPRAPFVFYPMAPISIEEKNDAIELSATAPLTQSKQIVKDFLTAVYGAGQSVATESDKQIVTVPFDFHPQGWWASLWSNITRVYPSKTVFVFHFEEQGDRTQITVQFRDVQQGSEPSGWISPVQNDDAYSFVVRLWSSMGRQLSQASAYLSSRDDATSFPIWVDHRGRFAVYLGEKSTQVIIEKKLRDAGMYLIPGNKPLVAPVPPEDVARVGDVIDFSVPTGGGNQLKLFNVYRRNLDDVSWELREYPYEISHQKAGDFLVIDVTGMDQPEVTSFRLVQRFIN